MAAEAEKNDGAVVNSDAETGQTVVLAAADGTAAPARRSKLQSVLIMTSLCTAVFLSALDQTIVSTALPTIADHFESSSGYVWVGSAFLLAQAVVAPSWGKLSDIWGRKIILLIAVAIFFIGSTLAAAATSLTMLLVGRAVQGTASGGLLSLASIVVGDLYSPRERGKYYGIIGMVWSIAFTLGPLIGGAFTRGVSWRWCFYINLPTSGLSFAIMAFLLKLDTPKTPFLAGIKVIDWPGTFALVGGALMLLFGLQLGDTSYPWNSPTIICLIVFGILTLCIFVAIERYVAPYPILPVHLYASPGNAAILLINLFHGIVFTQAIYFLPLYCQSVLGADPLLSGVLLLPLAVSMSVALVGAGTYLKRTGRYLDCIWLGFILLALGVGLMYDLPASTSWPRLIIYQIIAGFGIGLNYQPPLVALQSRVPAQDNAAVTSSFGLVRSLSAAIGVVVGSVAFANKMNTEQPKLIDLIGADNATLFTGSNSQANVLLVNNMPDGPEKTAVREAYWEALRVLWIVALAFSGAAFLACLLIRNKKLEETHVVVKTGLEGEEERRRIAMQHRAGKVAASEIGYTAA
ncbi:MFS multidrug transporter-like protein [Podospora australis]|uniref:Efflux pump dotC n=1 Tax=Podospora australis TaxID=1536484 RepID=A0AAN7AF04_9PEZI|nr:MFS multidrug transporter-like protein [Podospora australis]